jgi:hypothetical protein
MLDKSSENVVAPRLSEGVGNVGKVTGNSAAAPKRRTGGGANKKWNSNQEKQHHKNLTRTVKRRGKKTNIGTLPMPEYKADGTLIEERYSPSKKGNDLDRPLLERALPTKAKEMLTDELIDTINGLVNDSQLQVNYRENFLSFAGVLKEARFRLTDYITAVRYCSHKLMGDTNIVAYAKTFPERYQRMVDNGMPDKDINSMISGYHRGQLVTKIMEQAMVPSWLVNQDLYQKAINAQADLMMNGRSEKVRCDAANSLLTHLKMPEVAKVELDVTMKEDDSISELRRTTMDLVKQQRMMLESGAMNAKQIAEQKLVTEHVIDGEFEEVNR